MIITEQDLQTFANLPVIVKTYISSIPEKEKNLRRKPDDWTIKEHIYHIAFVQEMLLNRMDMIKKNDKPLIDPFFPEEEDSLESRFTSMDDAFSHYSDLREKQLQFIHELSSEEMGRQAIHGEYKHYSIPIILKHMIFHEFWHMHRIEEIWLTKDEYYLN